MRAAAELTPSTCKTLAARSAGEYAAVWGKDARRSLAPSTWRAPRPRENQEAEDARPMVAAVGFRSGPALDRLTNSRCSAELAGHDHEHVVPYPPRSRSSINAETA